MPVWGAFATRFDKRVCRLAVSHKFIILKIIPKTRIGKYPRNGVQSIYVLRCLHSHLGIKRRLLPTKVTLQKLIALKGQSTVK
jgi:hypothetical protein